MLIAQGHIINPINCDGPTQIQRENKLHITAHQVDLNEKPPVGQTISTCVTRLAQHKI